MAGRIEAVTTVRNSVRAETRNPAPSMPTGFGETLANAVFPISKRIEKDFLTSSLVSGY